MSRGPGDPRRSLEELEETRRTAESDLEGRLDELRRRVERLREQADAAEGLAAALDAWEPPRLESLEPAPGPEGRPEPEAPGEGPSRGLRGRLASWLLGDRLRDLERRDANIRDGLRRLREDLRDARSDPAADLSSVAEGQERFREELLRAVETQARTLRLGQELIEGVAEALEALVRVQGAMREVLEAKDAESGVRAAEGPGAKAELVLQEARRQQERILDALVGRRDELRALLEEIDSGDEKQD